MDETINSGVGVALENGEAIVPEKKIYTITLEDGTVLENLTLNGNNFVSKTEIKPEVFDGNLWEVSINDGKTTMTYQNMDLVRLAQEGDEWWFILRTISESEMRFLKIRSDIDYIAMTLNLTL